MHVGGDRQIRVAHRHLVDFPQQPKPLRFSQRGECRGHAGAPPPRGVPKRPKSRRTEPGTRFAMASGPWLVLHPGWFPNGRTFASCVRHEPESSVLYQVVQAWLETLVLPRDGERSVPATATAARGRGVRKIFALRDPGLRLRACVLPKLRGFDARGLLVQASRRMPVVRSEAREPDCGEPKWTESSVLDGVNEGLRRRRRSELVVISHGRTQTVCSKSSSWRRRRNSRPSPRGRRNHQDLHTRSDRGLNSPTRRDPRGSQRA